MNLKNLIEKGLMVILTALIGSLIAYFAMVGKHDRAIEIINITDKAQSEKIQALEKRTGELTQSRESLSDIYVTRREFNRLVEEQKSTLDKIDSKLEKLVDRFYKQP